MTSKQIDCAIELSHTLNFRRAAENLFTSQPSLTYQIQTLEEEVGFPIFYRSGKGATLTPAGASFCKELQRIRQNMKNAIENAQNYNSVYKESLTVAVPMRSAVYFLPHIMRQFQAENPTVSLTVKYIYSNSRIDDLLRGDIDITWGLETHLCRIPHLNLHPLFKSEIYLVTQKKDPLASLVKVTPTDLSNRTLIIGNSSPFELQKVQNQFIAQTKIKTINSVDNDTTMTFIAAGMGIGLVPGFCNDHSGEFEWTPFETNESISCVLASRKDDNRESVARFITIAREYYKMSAIQL
ncbi:MAG: LysR family transcriptional regulator [Lachnospiraceae bacterium]|nr:LysR family transcriptional regulator [Lachnospiraceae bacterium]MDD3617347.1 LysR family transcriptional regulator [Lachnospiraceae bacterium]